MRIRKTSLAALIAAAVLVVGMTAVFATSAKVDENLPIEDLDHRLDAAGTVTEDLMVTSYIDPRMGTHEAIAASADFTQYAPCGLTWNNSEKVLYLNGQRVCYFLEGVKGDGSGEMPICLKYADAELKGDIGVLRYRACTER